MTHARRSPNARSGPQPFWTRLPQIMLYPAQTTALIMLALLTLGSMAGVFAMSTGWWLMPLVLLVVVFVTTYKYAFEILRTTANGDMTAPLDVLNIGGGVVWRMIAMIIVYLVAVGAAFKFFGTTGGLLVLALVALMQPGCFMSLAIEGSLLRALNPMVPFAIMRRIGWSYLAAFGLLFVIQASALKAGQWIGGDSPVLGPLVLRFFSLWALFSTFHLMGYLVYQYHDELGYEPASEPYDRTALETPDSRLLEEAQTLVRDGRTTAALELLRMELRTRSAGVATHDLYHRLLQQHGDRVAVTEHARQYLHLLVTEKQDRQALALCRSALDLDPSFVPLHDEHVGLLANRARDMGQSQLATDILRAGLRAWPNHANAARWGLEAGVLLADRLGREKDAQMTLESALAVCSDDQVRSKIESTLQLLRTLPA